MNERSSINRHKGLWWLGTILLTLSITLLLLARPELSSAKAPSAVCRTPTVHVYKDKGELVVTCAGNRRLRVKATFGGEPTGHKLRSGDERTPEGRYRVCTKHPSRSSYKFVGIDYPAERDAKKALQQKRITRAQYQKILNTRRSGRCPSFNTPLGGAIGIHGVSPDLAWGTRIWNRLSRIGGLHRHFGFTDGCVAVTNEAIDRVWLLIKVGTPVHIHSALQH